MTTSCSFTAPPITSSSTSRKENAMFGILKGKKTYVAAALTVIGAFASYALGDLNAFQVAQLVVPAVLSAALRNGMR